jgi:phosphopantetheinyl transferase (holo-ACP synthase)
MYQEKIVDALTNEVVFRNYTTEEIAELEKSQTEAAERIAKQATKEIALKAIFAKLGITEDEAKLLLGGN